MSVVLETARLRLRPIEEADAAALHAGFGDPETMRFWDSLPARDVGETTERIRWSCAADRQFHLMFAITDRADHKLIGMLNYHDRRPAIRRLAVGWMLLRPWWRQGIMREAVPALLDHCFRQLDANRIEARIEPANAASVRLATWLGFQREGVMREWLLVDGKARDAAMFALLRADWSAGERKSPHERKSASESKSTRERKS